MRRASLVTADRTVRRGVGSRRRSRPEKPLDVGRLISPLRYGVLVRAQLFTLLARLDDDAQRDLATVVDAVQDSPYRIWFERVALRRAGPLVRRDPARAAAAFERRVAASLRLYQSFQERGFDPEHPIVLRGTRSPVVTDSGLRLGPRLYVGDGSHRAALLLSAGRLLEPQMCVIDWRPRRYLTDNTARLLPALGVRREAYVRFLAAGYDGPPTGDLDHLLAALGERDPDVAVEAAAVAERHLALTNQGEVVFQPSRVRHT